MSTVDNHNKIDNKESSHKSPSNSKLVAALAWTLALVWVTTCEHHNSNEKFVFKDGIGSMNIEYYIWWTEDPSNYDIDVHPLNSEYTSFDVTVRRPWKDSHFTTWIHELSKKLIEDIVLPLEDVDWFGGITHDASKNWQYKISKFVQEYKEYINQYKQDQIEQSKIKQEKSAIKHQQDSLKTRGKQLDQQYKDIKSRRKQSYKYH